jgi:hypothetical protein
MTEPVRVLQRRDFQRALDALATRGYRVVGPVVRYGALVHADVNARSDQRFASPRRPNRSSGARCTRSGPS